MDGKTGNPCTENTEDNAKGAAQPLATLPKKRRHRWGDRFDGRKLRTLSPATRIAPYIMKIRSDSQNHFEEEINITDIEPYIREQRAHGYKNFGLLHIFIGAYVRTVAQRPAINRFIAGNKIFARHNIEVVMTIKKKLSTTAPDTTMKCLFAPTDTIFDIYEKWNEVAKAAVEDDSSTNFDKTAKTVNRIPGFLLKFSINFLRALDYIGLMPRALLKVSPFHGSVAITSMGSLGIAPIYHHLYDFGNLPLFLSYGKKYTRCILGEDGKVYKRTYVGLRIVTDERICDGYYYAAAFKTLLHIIKDPRCLETPPETVVEDVE